MRSFTFFCALAAAVTIVAGASLPARADGASALERAALTSAKQSSYHTTFTAKSGNVIEATSSIPTGRASS